ncbi:PIH1 domain-containing protein 1 [Trypanosoma rangeli]|uniref:PIH1 domain-containing protein 1 n=1 Tax=Trypanosoma rangeli TaxID=5698 RepID=A0A422NU93_TRYRA|nr:PIH1 domain-containing protein 1 [Trypanosoma rangeli]RNF09024.1 PIH1 domain-containing protein 1 [Trypanosoma rangeli]|eukprot:RNF09024.1 PIH1 domain-containing protein 1 [Trypanosoma rangeli]
MVDVDVKSAGEALLKNPQFMELFQRALGGEEKLRDIPPEGDPRREKWLRDIQLKLQEESRNAMKDKLEEIQSDENGQWMYVLPEPGFCVKCTTAGGGKIFLNVCRHQRIAEPIPIEEDENAEEMKFKIPLSCGQARPDTDKSGKPCKVYDVIVNPSTVQRCSKDHEFRCFVVSLCIHWIKQKCEPTLNAEEYRNMNFKVKGVLEPQRIRLSTIPKAANAMGDEIRLPQSRGAALPPTNVGGRSGTGSLIQEVTNPPLNSDRVLQSGTTKTTTATTTSSAASQKEERATPSLVKLQGEGEYDWSRHAKPMLNPYLRENVPAVYVVEVCIPTVTSIAEVEVRVTSRSVELSYVDAENDAPFLTIPLDYPIDEDAPSAKFVRKTHMLKMRLSVKLPDETSELATKAERDADEIEEEEKRLAREEREKELEEHKKRVERVREEEEHVMKERKSYVENLAAVQEGSMPPSLKEELEKLPPDQLRVMLQRLENKIRKGDSIDEMLDKFPPSMIDAICRHIRDKLGLEQRPPPSCLHKEPPTANSGAAAPVQTAKGEAEDVTQEVEVEEGRVEYNFAKKSEKLFGVAFHNRYLFALD